MTDERIGHAWMDRPSAVFGDGVCLFILFAAPASVIHWGWLFVAFGWWICKFWEHGYFSGNRPPTKT